MEAGASLPYQGRDAVEPVAIIGMACRFPGDASNIANFWDMISNGRSAHSRIPESRFNADAYYHPSNDRRGAINTKGGYFLREDVSLFDAPFFNMTVKEAAGMDPMHRLTLEVAYESLENAGVPVHSLVNSNTSVYHGCFTGDYAKVSNCDIYDCGPYQATGNGLTMLSNRVSWFFDLRGPSMTIDTACSSSLYAVHLACQSLRTGESKMSIVSGSNLILSPDMMHSLTALQFLTPDGISHSFDARANGYARGEAIGALILKPLKAALADGDTIRGVIRNTGVNQDGKTPGITQPSSLAQAELIRATYKKAGLDFNETGYFEAHGTGTAIGDPLEVSAIGATIGAARPAEQPPLYVGSVKTNVGHTEGCAGIAGMIKAVLCLEHGQIPPNSGFESSNPKLKLEEWKIALPLSLTPWPSTGLRRANVNSFGYGGSNAFVIIDDAYHYLTSRGLVGNHNTLCDYTNEGEDSGFNSPTKIPGSDADFSPQYKLFPFSSPDQGGLQRLSKLYSGFLEKQLQKSEELSLIEDPDWRRYIDNLAYTLSIRRTVFDYRSFSVAPSLQKLSHSLDAGLPKQKRATKKDNAMWVFTGQGAQYAAMGKELLNNPVFRASLLKTQSYLEDNECPWDVIEELEKTQDSRVDSPEFSQPLCTALQIALVDTLTHWGLAPKAVVGHSSGEVGAAYSARAISHADAVKIAYQRGVYSAEVLRRQACGPGSMAAVALSEEAIQPYLKQVRPGSVVVACINSPSSVTISGDLDVIDELEALLKKENIFARKLRVQTAYHSHHMNVIAEEYRNSMGDIKPLESGTNSVPMFSSVTGSLVKPEFLDASYWVSNLVSPVRFVDACKSLLAHAPGKARRRNVINYSAMVEIGPHEALKGPLNQIVAGVDAKLASSLTYTSTLVRGQDAEAAAVTAIGKLWSQGFPVDLLKVNGQDDDNGLKALANLPPYPWNHAKGFWHEPVMSRNRRMQKHPRTDLLGVATEDQNPEEPRWRNFLSISENPWLEHHRIQDSVLFPGAGMLIMAIEAAKQIADETRVIKGFELRDVNFDRGLIIPSPDQAVETALHFSPHKTEGTNPWWRYTVFSHPHNGSWTVHSSGFISIVYEDGPNEIEENSEAAEEWKSQTQTYQYIQERGTRKVEHSTFYEELEAVGMQYGSLFRNVTEAYAAPGTLSGHGSIVIPDTKASMPHEFEFPHLIHPATLDAIFHLLFIGFTEGRPLQEAGVPYSMESMFISADLPQTPGEIFKAYSVTTKKGERESAGSLVISDSEWSKPKIVINHFAAREVSSGAAIADSDAQGHKICSQIQWQEDVDFMKDEMALKLLQSAGPDVESQLLLWLEKLCHKEGNLQTLVLADGIASLSTVLNRFGPRSGQRLRFKKCILAVPSKEALTLTEKMLADAEVEIEIELKVMDISNAQQSIDEPFDLILADTKLCSQESLKSIKNLLTSAGKIVLMGSNSNANSSQPESEFDSAGFPGIELFVKSAEQALIISSALPRSRKQSLIDDIVIIAAADESPDAVFLRQNLSTELTSAGYSVRTSSLAEAVLEKAQTIISLLEIEKCWVVDWAAEDLKSFQELVFSATHILWLTRGGQMLSSEAVDFATSTGLLRTVRTEVPQIVLPHLDLSPSINLAELSTANLILDVFNSTFADGSRISDLEFAEKDGKIMIPRLTEDKSFDAELECGTDSQKPIMAALRQPGRIREITMSKPGVLDSFYWIEDNTQSELLGSEEIEIVTSAVGLNAVDLLAAMGDTQITTIGCEASGVIARVGPNVTRFEPGQKVVTLKTPSFKTVLKQQQDMVQELPSNMTATAAAGCANVFTAAYHALIEVARLEKGETILIHSAAGGLGQAAIQVAQHIGAEIFVTLGSVAKKSILMDRYGIKEDHIFSSREQAFAKGIMRMTSQKGVDVILSFSTGETLRRSWLCIADMGRFVDVSLQKTDSNSLSASPFGRNATFASINMDRLLKTKPAKVTNAFQKAFDLIQQGVLTNPYPLTVYDACDVGKAFKSMQTGDHVGKLVINLETEKHVPVMAGLPAPLKLDPEATYVLSGGLGGLGPSLAQTMFEAGARSLAFLSRSGASTASAKQILEDFRANGCEAEAFACDVSQKADVEEFLRDANQRGWKIKGLVQCAMVLRDSTFDNMTFEKWTQATRPKVQGTWNLHNLLPRDMDFFIMLSSVVGIIGNAAQANYIAGNTYIDALAHLRRSQGLAAVSLDVGVVSDSGHFTDDAAFNHFLDRFPHLAPLQMTTPELNRILATLMKGATADGIEVPAQLITGVNDQLSRENNIASVWAHDRKFDHRVQMNSGSSSGAGSGSANAAAVIGAAKSLSDAATAVEGALKNNLATSLGTVPEDINSDIALHTYGVDSLKAVEVRNWLFRELKADISVFEILSPIPLQKLARKVASKSKLLKPEIAAEGEKDGGDAEE